MSDIKSKILSLVADDLKDVEKALDDNLDPYFDLVSKVSKHIIFSGGKRLRPLLMILSAKICGYNGNYDKVFSTIFEYLHTATLLHDDIIDEATMRRGKEVANILWDNSTAVLAGDFLLARSLSIASKTGKIEIIKIVAKITEMMSQGEIQQLYNKGNIELSEEEYMKVIIAKTAVLMEGACHAGALISDVSKEKEIALKDFGMNIGIAFQMADDLLDYTSDTISLGKKTGADLREGKLTIPVIYSLENARKNGKDNDLNKMKSIIKNEVFSDDEFEELKILLTKHEGIKYTQKTAEKYISTAKDSLKIFEESKAKEVLFMIADYALLRKA